MNLGQEKIELQSYYILENCMYSLCCSMLCGVQHIGELDKKPVS